MDETDFARMALYASRGYASLKTDAIKDALIAKLQEQVKGMTRVQPAMRGTGAENGSGSTRRCPPRSAWRGC